MFSVSWDNNKTLTKTTVSHTPTRTSEKATPDMGATNSRDPATMEDRPSPIEVVILKADAPTGTDLLPHHSSSPAQGNEQSGTKADEDVSEDEGEKSPRPITYSPNYAFMPDLIPPSPVTETRDRDGDEEKEKHRSGKDVMKRGRKPKERVVLSGKHVKIPARMWGEGWAKQTYGE
eukprot:g39774.t1